jgi:hypothetical protein
VWSFRVCLYEQSLFVFIVECASCLPISFYFRIAFASLIFILVVQETSIEVCKTFFETLMRVLVVSIDWCLFAMIASQNNYLKTNVFIIMLFFLISSSLLKTQSECSSFRVFSFNCHEIIIYRSFIITSFSLTFNELF